MREPNNQPSHNEISQQVARLDERVIGMREWFFGGLENVNRRMDKFEELVTDGFEKINDRLGRIEDAESQRKGALSMAVWLAGAIGALVALVVSIVVPHLWK